MVRHELGRVLILPGGQVELSRLKINIAQIVVSWAERHIRLQRLFQHRLSILPIAILDQLHGLRVELARFCRVPAWIFAERGVVTGTPS